MNHLKSVIAPLFVVCIAILFSSSTTFANEDKPIVNISQVENALKIKVHMANLQKQRTQITLIGADGNIWYSDYIWRKNGHSVNLSLQELEPGDYLVRVRNRNMQVIKAIALSQTSMVFFDQKSGAELESPNRRLTSLADKGNGKAIAHFAAPQSGKFVTLQLANLQGYPATFRITNTDTSGSLLEKRVKVNNGFGKHFNLEHVSDGSYYFYVKAGDLRVFQFFTIRGKVIELEDSMTHYGELGDSYSLLEGGK